MKAMIPVFMLMMGLGAWTQNLDSIAPTEEFDNIWVQRISDDSLQSNFVIWVKKSVPLHYHEAHSESVVILDGEGLMTLGDSTFMVRKWDHIHIEQGQIHGVEVTSEVPLRVLSTQCPHFDGSDRHFLKDR